MSDPDPDPKPTAVTVRCPGCGKYLPVPCRVLAEDTAAQETTVAMDHAPLRAHLADCARSAPKGPESEQPGKAVAKASEARPLPAFIAPGRRSCTMCGTPGADCLRTLQESRTTCCPACGDDNTHPAPRERQTCAEWGAEQAAKA